MSSRYSAAGAHQRDRTQLFGSPARARSPYEHSADAKYNQLFLLSLESQNNDELDTMGAKVRLLKDLGVRMGGEINKLVKLNDDITNSMEKGGATLKRTWGQMVVMGQRAGITWRMWVAVFALVAVWFLWVWVT